MNSSSRGDEDQDSLFGSPPPSPARGRSPFRETFASAAEIGPIFAVPSAGVGRKNVGTIALPGSHMSCAELPADLPASGLSLLRPISSCGSPSIIPSSVAGTLVVASRSSTHSIPSRTSVASNISSTSSTIRKRRTSKVKSPISASPVPPITLPGPNEPTPPNLLRSQSSLLGLAGLVGCVKPAQLYTRGPQPALASRSRSPSLSRGSTPAHPIVLDDDQDTSQAPEHARQVQIPQSLDQLNAADFRSNIMASLTKERNIFPVLESLIRLLGGEPCLPTTTPPPQPFARPYGCGIFNAQSPAVPFSTPGGSIAVTAAPPPKRRKLKHVPAGAVDWDVPFPFAVGEGPEAYHETWARDRAKQLVTQLLELVQNATRKAAIKTAKSKTKVSNGRTKAQKSQASRSASVETQVSQISSTQAIAHEFLSCTSLNSESTATGMSNNVSPTYFPEHCVGLLDSPTTIGSPASGPKDGMPVDSEGGAEGGSVASCDYSGFEEWLAQLQQFIPFETNPPTPESDCGSHLPAHLDSTASSPAPDVMIPVQQDALTASHTIRDEAIDPALLAISQQAGLTLSGSSFSPVPTPVPGGVTQPSDISSTPPVLAHSPRTSFSSTTEPLTPLSDAFADVSTSMVVHQDPICDFPRQLTGKDGHCRVSIHSSSPMEPSENSCISTAQKGKGRADDASTVCQAPSPPSQSTPSAVSTIKGASDKQVILERARKRRRELVAEIERAKNEMRELSIEQAVLVHFMRDGPSS